MILYILIYVNVFICLSSSTLHYPIRLCRLSLVRKPHTSLWLVSNLHCLPLIGQQISLLASHWSVTPSDWPWLVPGVGPPGIQHPWPHEAGDMARHHCHMSPPRAPGSLGQSEARTGTWWPIRGPRGSCVRHQAVTHVQLRLHSLSQHCNALVLTWCSLCHQNKYLEMHIFFFWHQFSGCDAPGVVWPGPGALLTMGLIPG